ncbi:hypothetical protein FPHYL_14113 [Fusarium phyllophilum]|uniref:Uncharacterized protein n=1 Tax=Fusarium phyllophilum TaxID=47803 RepID=A0A8H5I9I0_9HYPO|nr:hypothetical protein FPHYL_14113 [Fusarium phyllophilum]
MLRNSLPTGSFSQFPTEFRLAPRSTITQLSRRTFANTVTAYARECPEADAFVAAIERLPTAFKTPVDGENDGRNAKFPPTNFNSINWLARNAVRTISQGPVRRGVAQATPQKRRMTSWRRVQSGILRHLS